MRKVLLSVAVVFMLAGCVENQVQQEHGVEKEQPDLIKTDEASVDNKDICSVLEEIAEEVMSKRQEGVAMSKIMTPLTDIPSDNDIDNGVKLFVMGIVRTAYETPRYPYEDMQRRAIGDFRDKVSLDCYAAKNHSHN